MGKGFLTYSTAVILQAVANGYRYGFDIIDITGVPGGTVYPALRQARKRRISRLEVGRTEYRSGRATATSQVLRSHSRRPRGVGRGRTALPFSGTDAARQEAHTKTFTRMRSHQCLLTPTGNDSPPDRTCS